MRHIFPPLTWPSPRARVALLGNPHRTIRASRSHIPSDRRSRRAFPTTVKTVGDFESIASDCSRPMPDQTFSSRLSGNKADGLPLAGRGGGLVPDPILGRLEMVGQIRPERRCEIMFGCMAMNPRLLIFIGLSFVSRSRAERILSLEMLESVEVIAGWRRDQNKLILQVRHRWCRSHVRPVRRRQI